MTRILLTLYILVFTLACTDVLIPDIGEKETLHISPESGSILRNGDVMFEWELIDFADSTRFTLVSPSFADPQFICADTFTVSDRISFQLPTDRYEWKTVGYNDGFTSLPTISDFSIVLYDSLWLGGESITLLSPESGYRTKSDTITLSWNDLVGVEEYQFTVKDASGAIVKQLKLDSTSVKCVGLVSATYSWSVKGSNYTTLTETSSTERTFEIDRLAPDMPSLILPLATDTIFLQENGPDIIWDNNDALMAHLMLFSQTMPMDTIYQNSGMMDRVSLPDSLINTFSSDTVSLNLSLYTNDALGNVSDTLKSSITVVE